MADPIYVYVVPTGTIVPDTADIQTAVQDEYKSTFGADLVVTPDTPQGALIVSEILSRDAVASNNATLANQINPNLAGGVYLDAIMALTGSKRNPKEFSLVTATVTGVVGTIIPAGSQAKETSTNQIFETLTINTIPSGGTLTGVIFRSIIAGPIAVGINTLTVIITPILGWETVTNSTAGTLGSETQSDASARTLRRQTLALQGDALPESIISALYATADVKSVAFRENISPNTQIISGVTMVGHSIYACVDGGSDIDIANVLLNKKSGGCAYNNGPGIPISQTIVVPFSNQIMQILFDRPNLITITCTVTCRVDSSIDDPVTSVRDAIISYANGDIPNETGLIVGQDVSSFEFAGAITYYNPGIFVSNVEIAIFPNIQTNAVIAINVYEKAVINSGNITVVVLP